MRMPWWSSYFSFKPRRIEMVSSTLGSSVKTGWNLRASAASFSIYLRYSSSVVAPTQCSSPRASAGLRRLDASIEPSAAPAPTSVWSSSMNSTVSNPDSESSFSTAFKRSSNSPRNFAPATSAPRSSESNFLSFKLSGTSPAIMRWASPSTIAVLPTPGSPISTGLFFVRRESTCIVLLISSSLPMTGSSFPLSAAAVKSLVYFFSASKLSSAFEAVALRPLRIFSISDFSFLASRPPTIFASANANKSISDVTKSSPKSLDFSCASSKIFAKSVET